jgi:hypothetical protein
VSVVRVEDGRGGPVLSLINSDTLEAAIVEGVPSALVNSVTADELDIPKLH